MTLHIDRMTEVEIGDRVHFSPFVYVGCPPLFVKGATARWKDHPNIVRIGDDTKVGSFATIYRDAFIGKNCLIGTGAIIREGVRIGDNCVIGAGVEVSYEVEIGNDVKVMSLSHVTGRSKIGDGSFVGVKVTMSNDRHINLDDYRFPDKDVRGPQIGKKVMVGSGANLVAGITIGDGALIGSGALVTKDVPAGARAMSKAAVATW
ncbi:MAG: transferase [Alphaproteobacteria bacterium]|nr:transferase [Alphaproteobacteria bacterium]